MQRDELLKRLAQGARLYLTSTPWGSRVQGALLRDETAPDGHQLIPGSKVERLLEMRLLRHGPVDEHGNIDLILTRIGLAAVYGRRAVAAGLPLAANGTTGTTGAAAPVAPAAAAVPAPRQPEAGIPDYSFAFQPIVDVERGAVVAYEAFARRRGDRSSAHLMRALPTDAIHRFDDECRVAAMTVAERLGIRHRLHVNCFLPEQAETQVSLEQTAAAALRLGYQRGRLVLENKADEIIDRPEAYAARMQPLRDQGLNLALSEIGASSAGLNLVAAIRPDIVKLSRKTVHGVGKDGRQQRFVPQAVQLCRSLGIAVIAECVETLEQYRWLRNAGVHLFQGNLFAAPAFEAAPPARLP